MTLLVLSTMILPLNILLLDLYPAVYEHYLRTGTLHWGLVSLPPGTKPDFDSWLGILFFLLACIAFKWEEVQEKKRDDVSLSQTSK
jgi:hypothetical protein